MRGVEIPFPHRAQLLPSFLLPTHSIGAGPFTTGDVVMTAGVCKDAPLVSRAWSEAQPSGTRPGTQGQRAKSLPPFSDPAWGPWVPARRAPCALGRDTRGLDCNLYFNVLCNVKF